MNLLNVGWGIVCKWRDWSLLGAQTFSPNEQEGKRKYIHAHVCSGQQELRRNLLIVAISSKQKKYISYKGGWEQDVDEDEQF